MGYVQEFDQEQMLDLIVNQPMSREEQVALLKEHDKRVFLDGIDKGTELERKIQKENRSKIEKKYKKELSLLVDDINDRISEHIEKNKYKK